jgi:hypothetical protein
LSAPVQSGGGVVVQLCGAGFVFGIENGRVRTWLHVDGVRIHRIQVGGMKKKNRDKKKALNGGLGFIFASQSKKEKKRVENL